MCLCKACSYAVAYEVRTYMTRVLSGHNLYEEKLCLWYVVMCICMFACMNTQDIYIYIYIYNIYTFMYVCMHVCTYMYVCIYVCICVYLCM